MPIVTDEVETSASGSVVHADEVGRTPSSSVVHADEVGRTASGSVIHADEVGQTTSGSVVYADEVGRTPSGSVDFTDEVDRTTRHSVLYMNGGACVRMGGQIRSAPACVLRLRASCARACLASVCVLRRRVSCARDRRSKAATRTLANRARSCGDTVRVDRQGRQDRRAPRGSVLNQARRRAPIAARPALGWLAVARGRSSRRGSCAGWGR